MRAMDKSPILPEKHDASCRRSGPGDLDVEHCERCRNLKARLEEWRRATGLAPEPESGLG